MGILHSGVHTASNLGFAKVNSEFSPILKQKRQPMAAFFVSQKKAYALAPSFSLIRAARPLSSRK